MNQDAKRATGRGVPSERHAIGITRMCLRSGSVQLPFALSGSLPEGELLVHDAEADEPIVLWSEPPRRLSGLAALFERHEVQVNDQLVLEVRGDDVRIAVAKRPRRTRPKVTPSTWASHRDAPRDEASTHRDHPEDAPRGTAAEAGADDADLERRADGAAHATTHRAEADRHGHPEHASGGDATASEQARAGRDGRRTGPAQVRPPDESTSPPGGRATWAQPIDGEPRNEPDDDAPRAPRVTVRPASDARSASREGEGAAAGAADDLASERGPTRRSRGGPFAGLMRAARGWFGGDAGRREDEPGSPEDDADREALDWIDAWDVDGDESDADPDAFDTTPALGRAVEPGNAAGQPRGRTPGVPVDPPPREPAFDEASRVASRREPQREPLDEAVVEAARRRPDAEADRAADNSTDNSTDPLSRGVTDRGPDTREARVATPEPDVTAERSDRVADEPREPADEPATPAQRSADARTPLFPAPPGDAPPDQAPPDEAPPGEAPTGEAPPGQDGQVSNDAPAIPADSAPTPAHAAGAHRGSAKAPPVDTSPEHAATLPSGVPIRAERFLGGDLRTRLLRFLTSPEMPLIAKTDLIAKRFDLEPATAQEMLEDIADDPPDGLRLTVVREGAWRIERRSA